MTTITIQLTDEQITDLTNGKSVVITPSAINTSKSELEIIKEKYESGNYICIARKQGDPDWWLNSTIEPKWYDHWEYKLIHKNHKEILDAYLADNSVEIEFSYGDAIVWDTQEDFISRYNEKKHYRLKPKQEYPIFKRNEDGEVFKIISSDSFGTQYETMLCKDFNERHMLSGETIPHDTKTGLYHLQPVWCWDDEHKSKVTMFYDVELKMAIGFIVEKGNEYHWDNIEPITPEQLKTMPFIWDMYTNLLKFLSNTQTP